MLKLCIASLCLCGCDHERIFFLTTPSLSLPPLLSIFPLSVLPDPPTGSASFSVSPTVAPQLLCMLSWVTWINDNSRGFTDQAHPLHNPGRSAADPLRFWHLMRCTVLRLPPLTLFTLFSISPLCVPLHTYGAVVLQPYGKCHKHLSVTCAVEVIFLNTITCRATAVCKEVTWFEADIKDARDFSPNSKKTRTRMYYSAVREREAQFWHQLLGW